MLLVSKNGPVRTKIILLPIKTTFEAIVKNETVAVKIKKKKKKKELNDTIQINFSLVCDGNVRRKISFSKFDIRVLESNKAIR